MKRLTEFDVPQDPSFSQAVIDWQRAHGRHTLPWQNTRDPYRVWLSEIMLQQTQVAAVLGYYARFLERFPSVHDLAGAPIEDVMAHWSGLGYYTRARNLHACAVRVVNEYGGEFPVAPSLLADLPGIGRSTAAAITAFAHGTRAAILDGNVKRVFARVFGVEGYPGEKRIEDALWRRADALLPEDGMESYTQGLMDLGATLCTRSRPACPRCPLQARCVAYATGRTEELPVRKPKKTTPEKRAEMLVLLHDGCVLLEQRPASGIWGGLLSLPEVGGHAASDTRRDGDPALAASARRFGAVEEVQALLPLVHVFTHYKLHIHPHKVVLGERGATPPGHVWVRLATVGDAALPAPVKKLLVDLAQPGLFG
ncbi:A/G-specific adenine glycosylase [Massilia jejuensis]|uniref:Adenine DNA glycosylase n=1 Tax=Massilia jejuensis TaxID=648894 RepID=A0ABW0PKF6_9BURK